MVLVKGKQTVKRELFVTRNRNQLNFSASVRDLILPHKFIKIELDKDKNIIFTPTDEPNEYSVVMSNYQMKIGICSITNLVNIENGRRMHCEKLSDGRILCRTGALKGS